MKVSQNKLLPVLARWTVISIIVMLAGCEAEIPMREDVPELITQVVLTFTSSTGGDPVVVTATDPDGEGVQNLTVDGPIVLSPGVQYVLTLGMTNGLAGVGDPAYDIAAEVEELGDEHQFFFSWTNDVFSDPAGDGNIDNRDDPVNYTGGANSVDKNNRPLGLTTTWTAATSPASGQFRILLKHQPGLKSDSSDSSTGETDMDITFDIQVK